MVDKVRLLTTKEAARFLRVSLTTLYRMEKLGYISAFRTPGGQRRFSQEEIERYLKKSKSFKYSQNNNHKLGGENNGEKK